MAANKKPRGFGKFNALTRKLVQVDKAAVDKRISAIKRSGLSGGKSRDS